MREIKFRAWIEFNNNFAYMSGDGIFRSDCEAFEYEYVSSLGSIEQYTGVKDMNGKEVYEGDILERVTETVVWKFKGVVEFQLDGSLGWCVQTNEGRWNLNSRDVYKVIGNIHENLELIKEVE